MSKPACRSHTPIVFRKCNQKIDYLFKNDKKINKKLKKYLKNVKS